MEYNINDFVSRLRDGMYRMFPYEPDMINELKHMGENQRFPRPKHIRDVAFMDNGIETINENTIVFDIGNEESERDYPYYHILEDVPVIRKAHKGTKATKGSQDKVENLGQRDYGRVTFNGKTYSKEYSKNVRGARKSVVLNSTRYIRDYNGDTIKINRGANQYQNVHYQYIEKMMSMLLPQLAVDFDMKLGRTIDNGLMEEYTMQEHTLPSDDIASVIQVLNM